jgi:hypothetical protein
MAAHFVKSIARKTSKNNAYTDLKYNDTPPSPYITRVYHHQTFTIINEIN